MQGSQFVDVKRFPIPTDAFLLKDSIGMGIKCRNAKEYNKTYYPQNKARITARTIQWQKENKEKYAIKSRRHYENNKEKAFANSAKYRASRRNACPSWLDKTMKEQIEQMYANARKISQDTGVAHEVDHIVPLVNSAVCGLHVPWNLQILTQFENRSKRNNLENING